MNSPNRVTTRGKPKRRRARPFFDFLGAAPPRDVTLLHVQPVAAIRGAPRRALGVRYCPGGVLIRSLVFFPENLWAHLIFMAMNRPLARTYWRAADARAAHDGV